jgi:hypothetical protein
VQLNKYNKLAKAMIPVDDPNISTAVKEANENCHLIIEKTKGATGSEDKTFLSDDVQGNNNSEEGEFAHGGDIWNVTNGVLGEGGDDQNHIPPIAVSSFVFVDCFSRA